MANAVNASDHLSGLVREGRAGNLVHYNARNAIVKRTENWRLRNRPGDNRYMHAVEGLRPGPNCPNVPTILGKSHSSIVRQSAFIGGRACFDRYRCYPHPRTRLIHHTRHRGISAVCRVLRAAAGGLRGWRPTRPASRWGPSPPPSASSKTGMASPSSTPTCKVGMAWRAAKGAGATTGSCWCVMMFFATD